MDLLITQDDTNKLKDSSFIESIAIGHANGIASAFGLTRKPVSAVNSTVPTTNNLFKVQIGAYRDEDKCGTVSK